MITRIQPGRSNLAPLFGGVAVALIWNCSVVFAGSAPGARTPAQAGVYARVGDDAITTEQLERETRLAMRRRFYHFRPPEAEAQVFRREVAGQVIVQTLLLQEAERRNIKPDRARVDKLIDGYDQRYRNSPGWSEQGPGLLEALRVHLEAKDRVLRLEEQVRSFAAPGEQALRDYYARHPEQFTEPPRRRLSLILLKVDPSSPNAAWESAVAQGQRLVSTLREDGNFAELAKLHSADTSAQRGGDMGYLHRGMLSEPVEAAIDDLAIGEVSEPIRMLEGVAIFRLEAYKPEQKHTYDAVRDRVLELWHRQEGDRRWQALLRDLRHNTHIEVLDPSLTPAYEDARNASESPT